MVSEYVDPREWTVFPPKGDADRLARYDEYRALLMGEHNGIFCHDKFRLHKSKSELSKVLNAAYDAKEQAEVIYVSTNYCKIASQLFANMLFGSPPAFSVEQDGSVQQQRLDRIVENNMLDVVNHQQEVEASSLGDAFYRLRWGSMVNWREEGVIIEAIPAGQVYPILNVGNVKDNLGYCVTNTVHHAQRDYLYKELHFPYWIYYQLFTLEGDEIGAQVPLGTVPAYEGLAALGGNAAYTWDGDTLQYETGYQGLLVEHVPNWTRPDQFFGISDYTPDVVSNQAAINEMKTGILRTCLKHMDPILAVPMDVFSFDEKTGNLYAKKEDLQAIGLDPDSGNVDLPRYITWDAKLEAATTNIDACFDAMMLSFGISPAIFGMGKYGLADSGTALKLRMTQTLWLVGQKRMYFDAALKNILYAAQWLDGTFGPEQYEAAEVSITWPETLPKDLKEQAEALSQMVSGGMYSRETAVAQAQSLEGDALRVEMDKINADHVGTWLTTVGIPLLTTGAIDSAEFIRQYNAQAALDEPAQAAKEPEAFPEEE